MAYGIWYMVPLVYGILSSFRAARIILNAVSARNTTKTIKGSIGRVVWPLTDQKTGFGSGDQMDQSGATVLRFVSSPNLFLKLLMTPCVSVQMRC